MKKTNYWAKRQAKSNSKLTTIAIEEVNAQLRSYYKAAADKVVEDFEATLDKIKAAEDSGKEPTPADLYKLDKYWKAQAACRDELQKLGDKTAKKLQQKFESHYINVYNNIMLHDSDNFSEVNHEAVRKMVNSIWCADGQSWSSRVWKNTGKLQEILNEHLIHCVATGRSSRELKQMLMNDFNVSYNSAKTLVTTELAHIETIAAQERYKSYGIQEYEIYGEPDACPECKKLFEKRFVIHSAAPVPAHPNCRCCILPVVEF